jgi:hypothetical protein
VAICFLKTRKPKIKTVMVASTIDITNLLSAAIATLLCIKPKYKTGKRNKTLFKFFMIILLFGAYRAVSNTSIFAPMNNSTSKTQLSVTKLGGITAIDTSISQLYRIENQLPNTKSFAAVNCLKPHPSLKERTDEVIAKNRCWQKILLFI